jgi:serine/threonine protein kinase/tetratricopeptide (TPR) repeat protein
MINNRYKIIKNLGKGRGNIFLVEDSEREKELFALKAISRENISSEEIQSLINEFRILKRFNHPNVVKVFDFAKIYESDNDYLIDSFFYTAEYIEGQNLLEFFNFTPTSVRDDDYNDFLEVLSQVCITLFHIHQSGLIHYDIKPENILIKRNKSDSKPQIKIIDFGFCNVEGTKLHGTPAYVSPEIIKGEAADHRSDLYSLGATLYHLFANFPPFESGDRVELLKMHLTEKPKDLPDIIPNALCQVIAKLLNKNPVDRYSNAIEIIAALKQGRPFEYENIWYFSKVLTTRSEEIELIEKFISNGKKDPLNGYLVFGEEGTGKSILLETLEQTFNDKHLIVYLSNNPQPSFRAYDFWLTLMTMILEKLKSNRSKGQKDQAIIEAFNKLNSLFVTDSEKLMQLESFRMELAEALINYTKYESFVLLIDNFQNIDKVSKDFFKYILPSLHELGIKSVLTLHPSVINDEFIKSLPNFETIVLSPLNREQIIHLLRVYFKLDFPYDKTANLILEYTDCLPRSIKDILGFLFQKRILAYDEKGFHFHEELVDDSSIRVGVDKIHESKYEQLSLQQKDLLKYLSCFSSPVMIDDFAALIGWKNVEIRDAVQLLISLGWVYYEPEARALFIAIKSFRKFVYLLFSDRNLFHKKIAEEFEKLKYPYDIIANHYELSGYRSEAYKYYTKAAVAAERLEAYSLMEEILDKASINLQPEDDHIEINKNYVRCYYHLSQFNKTAKLIEEILADNHCSQKEKFQYTLWLATTCHHLGELDKSLNNFDKAFNYALTDEEKVTVEIEQMNIDANLGNYSFVKKRCKSILKDYDKIISDKTRASIFNNLGIAHFMEGNYDLSLKYFNNALRICESNNDKVKLSQLNMNLGNVFNIKGKRDEANKFWIKAMEINESYGDLSQKAKILNNMGISAYDELEYEEAMNYYKESKEIFERIGDTLGVGMTLFNISETAFSMCDYKTAYECLIESKEHSQKLIDNEGLAQSLFYLGQLYLIFNQLELAEKTYDKLEELIEMNKLQPSQMPFMLYLSGSIKIHKKEYEEAEIKIMLARDLFRENSIQFFELKSSILLMTMYLYLGKYNEVNRFYNELVQSKAFIRNKVLHAEALLLMGKMTKRPGVNLQKSAVEYFSEGLALLENMPISEVTWQLVFYLGEEYLAKGIYQRGMENLNNANLLISYLCSSIDERKFLNSYLNEPERKRILEKISKNLVNYSIK